MPESHGIEIPHWLDVSARSSPTRLALAFDADRWTFADLNRSVDAAALVLSRSRQDTAGRVGILSANRPGFVFAVHAATRIAASFVPLNWRQTSTELAWHVRDAGIKLLVADEERMATATAACAGLPVTVMPIEELERAPALGGCPKTTRKIGLDREAAVIYTSGTSGRPKGARLTYGNFWFSAVASALHLGHRPDDVWLAAMPLFHVGGLSILFRGAIGATPVVLHDRFDPKHSLNAIDAGVTLLSLVPVMLQRMLAERGDQDWPTSLRCVLLGGSAAPSGLVGDCLRLGIPVAPTYGLTEASSQVTTLLPVDVSRKPLSSGLALPLTEVRIISPSGSAPAGEIGQIEIRGPALFSGYLEDDDATADRTADGWFQTGDAGYLDEDGYLYVVDRRDDVIVSGAENIYPAEIERVLLERSAVRDAGVFGVQDEQWGARPVAAVVWEGDPRLAEEILRNHCGEQLARYKIPDQVVVFPELPRSPSGKLLRRELREMFANDPKCEF